MKMFFNLMRFFSSAKFKEYSFYIWVTFSIILFVFIAGYKTVGFIQKDTEIKIKVAAKIQENKELKQDLHDAVMSSKISIDSVVALAEDTRVIELKYTDRIERVKKKVIEIKAKELPPEVKSNEVSIVYITNLNALYSELNEKGNDNET